MKLKDLAVELKISTESIKKFIQDFDLDVNECISSSFEIKPEFEKFAKEHSDFLLKYEKDLEKDKTIDDIVEKISQPKDKVEEILNKEAVEVLDNGIFKTSVSSFGIDNKLGGNYRFVYDYFGNKTPLTKKDFIGYSDLFFFITDILETFINDDEVKNWGIHRPAGMVLYGPPGSGKIFWAGKIAEIIGYQLTLIKKYYLGTSFVKGGKTTFNEYLISVMKEDKIELLMEDFDEIMQERNENYSRENEQTKEIVMHFINKFEQENIFMIGSANSISGIDKEVLAPGRFDVQIPIFPPNAKERAEIILYSLTKNLCEDALLLTILKNNNANHVAFWNDTALKMRCYSSTMVIDFTQSLKKQIRNQYKRLQTENIKISEEILNIALRDSAAKLTEEYLNQVQQFAEDVALNNPFDFPVRLVVLQMELNSYKAVEEPIRTIGFHNNQNNEQEE